MLSGPSTVNSSSRTVFTVSCTLTSDGSAALRVLATEMVMVPDCPSGTPSSTVNVNLTSNDTPFGTGNGPVTTEPLTVMMVSTVDPIPDRVMSASSGNDELPTSVMNMMTVISPSGGSDTSSRSGISPGSCRVIAMR